MIETLLIISLIFNFVLVVLLILAKLTSNSWQRAADSWQKAYEITKETSETWQRIAQSKNGM